MSLPSGPAGTLVAGAVLLAALVGLGVLLRPLAHGRFFPLAGQRGVLPFSAAIAVLAAALTPMAAPALTSAPALSLLALAAALAAAPLSPRFAEASLKLNGAFDRLLNWPAGARPARFVQSSLARFLPGPDSGRDLKRAVAAAYAVLIAAGAVAALLWIWGEPAPRSFALPDEANNRIAAIQIASTGKPFLPLPYEDVEGLLGPRFWSPRGVRAVPIYPPFTFYLYGAGLKLGPAGEWLPVAMSALAIAALAVAGLLLARGAPALGALLPFMAFPALYWMLRPWANTAVEINFVSLALLAFVLWARRGRDRYLGASVAFVTLAALARPDHAAYLFAAALSAGLFVHGERWRRILVYQAAGAAVMLVVAVALNWITTGDPLVSGYQLARRDAPGAELRDTAPPLVSALIYATAPDGLNPVDVPGALGKYWFTLGPVWLLALLFAFVAVRLGPSLAARRRWAAAALLVVAAAFWLTRVNPGVFGMEAPLSNLQHSFVRYTAPVYLLVAAITVAGVGNLARRAFPAVSAVALALAAAGAFYVYAGSGMGSLTAQRATRDTMAQVFDQYQAALPANAVIYSRNLDAVLWPGTVLVANLPSESDFARLADSMVRAKQHGYQPFVSQFSTDPARVAELRSELANRGERLLKFPLTDVLYLEMDLRPPSD